MPSYLIVHSQPPGGRADLFAQPPTIDVSGLVARLDWGDVTFEVPPGDHRVAITVAPVAGGSEGAVVTVRVLPETGTRVSFAPPSVPGAASSLHVDGQWPADAAMAYYAARDRRDLVRAGQQQQQRTPQQAPQPAAAHQAPPRRDQTWGQQTASPEPSVPPVGPAIGSTGSVPIVGAPSSAPTFGQVQGSVVEPGAQQQPAAAPLAHVPTWGASQQQPFPRQPSTTPGQQPTQQQAWQQPQHLQQAPGQHAPGQHAPGQHAPGQHAPGQHAPGQHAPQQQAPVQRMPQPGQQRPQQQPPQQPLPQQGFAPHVQQPFASQPLAPHQPAPHQPAPHQPAPHQPAPQQPAHHRPAQQPPVAPPAFGPGAPQQPPAQQGQPQQPAFGHQPAVRRDVYGRDRVDGDRSAPPIPTPHEFESFARAERERHEAETRPQQGWYPDPYGRSDVRWHDGERWTASVLRQGRREHDPV